MLQNIIFRIAKNADISGVIDLQGKYLLANIAADKRENGFVTTPFTVAQIEEIIAQDGLFVAESECNIIAYVFAGSWDYFAQWPIFPFMVSRLALANFPETITKDNSFQYGPICIDEHYRGSGIFQKLFETMRIGMSKQYAIGVTFINKLNKRSYQAHTRKLQMKVVDEFEFNSNNFYGLAFLTREDV